jgi:hypothetical protein
MMVSAARNGFSLVALHTATTKCYKAAAMIRATFTIAVAFLCGTAAAQPQSLVTFVSPCECSDNHGKARLAVKEDASTPPADASAIQAVAPSDIFQLAGMIEERLG